MRRTLFAVVVILALGWIAWPYYAAYDLARAIDEGNVETIDARVDWARVKAGLRNDLAMALVEMRGGDLGGGKLGAVVSSLAALAGPSLVDRALDSIVNAQTLAALVRRQAAGERPVPQQGPPAAADTDQDTDAARAILPRPTIRDLDIDWGTVRYAFFTGLNRFQVDVAAEPGQPPLGLVFRFDGDWRLASVDLPVESLRNALEARR